MMEAVWLNQQRQVYQHRSLDAVVLIIIANIVADEKAILQSSNS